MQLQAYGTWNKGEKNVLKTKVAMMTWALLGDFQNWARPLQVFLLAHFDKFTFYLAMNMVWYKPFEIIIERASLAKR